MNTALVAPFAFAALPLAFLAPAPAAASPLVVQDQPAAGSDDPVPPIQGDGDDFILTFSEDPEAALSLEDFVKTCQEATGLNFVVPPDSEGPLSTGTVRMFGQKRIPKRDFYSFFQIIMFINDFACIEVGAGPLRVIVVQQLSAAQGRTGTNIKQRAEYVLPADLSSYADEPATLITTILTLKHIDVRQLTNNLRGLFSDTVTQNMLPVGNSDSLVLTGFGSSIWSVVQLLRLVDEEAKTPDPVLPVFDKIPLQFAAPDDAAELIEQLLESQGNLRDQAAQAAGGAQTPGQPRAGAGASSTSASVIVERRTNSLLVVAMPDELPQLKELIASIDTEVLEPERNFRIYALENVSAEELAETLNTFLDDAQAVAQQGAGTGTGGQTARAGGSGGGDGVVVVPEPTTNTLLIAANKTRYEEIQELILALDRRADQVLIETALIELSNTDFTDIGVELGFADITGDGGFGVTSFGLSALSDLDGDGIVDARVPNITNGVTGGFIDGDNFSLPFLTRLLRTRQDANILNIPSILVNNNSGALVSTLEEQPTTQITAVGGVSGQTQENFQGFQEAGITLSISPSISASRYLRLQISLIVSNFLGMGTGAVPPPRVTREINTTVNVPDGDTMVIGGVVTDNNTFDRQQTPWLGSIPLIGALFRRDTTNESRLTLYFFVTPHILADEDFADLAELTYGKKLEAAQYISAQRLRQVDPNFGESELGDTDHYEFPVYQTPSAGEIQGDEVGLDPVETIELLENSTPDKF